MENRLSNRIEMIDIEIATTEGDMLTDLYKPRTPENSGSEDSLRGVNSDVEEHSTTRALFGSVEGLVPTPNQLELWGVSEQQIALDLYEV